MLGRESSRKAASYKGARALFLLLSAQGASLRNAKDPDRPKI